MSVIEVTVQDVHERLKNDTPTFLLDVREPEEVALAALSGAAHIPMSEVGGRLDELPQEREIIVFCHHGMRSQAVAAYLAQSGFQAVSMRGGIDAWSAQIDGSVPRY